MYEEDLRVQREEDEKKKKEKSDEELARRVHEEEIIRAREEEKRARQRRDEEFAQRMLEQERRENERIRNLSSKDAEVARALVEEEIRKMKEEEEKLNWERTMNMIRNEVRVERDAELAKALREKEDLELRLQDMYNRPNHYNNYDVEFPNMWIYQNRNFIQTQLAAGSYEYNTVLNKFNITMRGNTVYRIERIQNKSLWTWFNMKKNYLNNKFGTNERTLFYIGSQNFDSIKTDGFQLHYSTGGHLGYGLYFTDNASGGTSSVDVEYHCTSHRRRNRRTERRMLMCRVLLGSVGVGYNSLRRAPNMPGRHEQYDSVSTNSITYSVFDNNLAYPEYIIYYY